MVTLMSLITELLCENLNSFFPHTPFLLFYLLFILLKYWIFECSVFYMSLLENNNWAIMSPLYLPLTAIYPSNFSLFHLRGAIPVHVLLTHIILPALNWSPDSYSFLNSVYTQLPDGDFLKHSLILSFQNKIINPNTFNNSILLPIKFRSTFSN